MAIRKVFLPEGAVVLNPQKLMDRPWLSWCRDVMANIAGVFVTPRFDAATFTAATGTWTVAEADVTTLGYFRVGKLAFLFWNLVTTSVSATPASLSVALPNDWVASQAVYALCDGSDNGTAAVFSAHVDAGGTVLIFARQDGANFATAVDTTSLRGQMFFEVQ